MLSESTAAADEVLRQAQHAGIDVAAGTAELEREGVRCFCASYHERIDRITSKTEGSVVATERPAVVK